MSSHRNRYKKWKEGSNDYTTCYNIFDKYGIENCEIYLIEKFPCDTKDELHSREGYYIQNNSCVNKCIAGRSKREYYEDNRDSILERVKQYRQDNIDKVKAKDNTRKKVFVMCTCGELIKKNNSRHLTSKKHLDKVGN